MRLAGFNLNQLVCLEALLSERNVTRAADRVHLSQSAMSSVLGQLREHFGDSLLVRSGRNLVLTPFAKSLIPPLSELMAKTQTFSSMRPDQGAAAVDRELKIIGSDYAVQTCLSDAIRKASADLPGLRFDILPLSDNAARLLQSGEIDLLLAGQSLDVGLPPKTCLFEDKFVCLACAEHGPQTAGLTRAEYLQRKQVVVRYFEHQMSFEDEETLRRAGVQRPRHVSVWSFSLVPYMICGTPMIATVTARIADQIAARWPVRIYPFPFDHQPVRVFAYWHPSRDGDAVLNQFMRSVKINN